MITRCPACGTMFRVVPDQLRISEGWVRCGHCAEVFDAPAHMMSEAAVRAHEAAVPPPSTPPPAEAGDVPPPADTPLHAAGAGRGTTSGAADDAAAPAVPAPPVSIDSGLRESELDQPFVFRRSDMGQGDEPAATSLPPSSVPPPAWRPSTPALEEEEAADNVSFLQQGGAAQRPPPARRALLALLALLLALLLAGQYAVHDRDRLVALEPALRPGLERMCELAGCTLGPLRQIEALAIDASGFNKLRTDAYRLSFTLRNHLALPVAVPSMELTLTDGNDQAVVRRVLSPAELGAPGREIPAGSDWSASVALAVNAAEAGARIAGYRLLAFYP